MTLEAVVYSGLYKPTVQIKKSAFADKVVRKSIYPCGAQHLHLWTKYDKMD